MEGVTAASSSSGSIANLGKMEDVGMGIMSDKEFTLHFITIYRDMPVLWKIKSKDYMDKNKRSAAIKKMTNLLKMCRQNITENEVIKKINILRTSFNRENNKVKKSMLSGSGTDDLYVPSVWYYKELQFLQDQMECESRMSTIIEQESSSSTSIPSQSTENTNPLPLEKKKKQEDLQQDLMILARDHFKKPENEYQVMARNWSFKLERMSPDQRRLAEKFINEILFEGEEGNLSRHSVTINPNSTYFLPAHSISRHVHSIYYLSHSISLPAHSISRHIHSIYYLLLSISLPAHSISRHVHSISYLSHSISLAANTISQYHPISYPSNSTLHTQASASQTSVLISTEQTNLPNVEPVMIDITESNPNEAESPATFIKTFSAF